MSNILNPAFKYTNSVDSLKPGYLKAKFDAIRKKNLEKESHIASNANGKPCQVTVLKTVGTK